jgi:hypothetical protein
MDVLASYFAVDRLLAFDCYQPRVTSLNDNGQRAVALAFDYREPGVPRTGAGLGKVALADDWVLVVDSAEVMTRIWSSAFDKYGVSPNQPKKLESGETVKFDIQLREGRIAVTLMGSRWGMTAMCESAVTLRVEQGRVVAAVGDLTGDGKKYLKDDVLSATKAMLQTVMDGPFDFLRLGRLVDGNEVIADPVSTGIEIHPEGIRLHGTIVTPANVRSPVAEIRVNARDQNGALMLNRRTFDISASWAPSGYIKEIGWSIDGRTERNTGAARHLLSEYVFTPGEHTVEVTITDDGGRRARAQTVLEVAVLRLGRSAYGDPEWIVCSKTPPFSAEFTVTCSGESVEGATVTATAGSWSSAPTPIISGSARIQIMQTDEKGVVHVSATAPGYLSDAHDLKVANCELLAAIQRLAAKAKMALQRWPMPPGPPPVLDHDVLALWRTTVAIDMLIKMPDPVQAMHQLTKELGIVDSDKNVLKQLEDDVARFAEASKVIRKATPTKKQKRTTA